MNYKNGLVLALLLLGPGLTQAGPFFGDLGWLCPGKDCPAGEYCLLHYWVPGLYKVRANVHPSNLDQFSPGPCPPIVPQFEKTKYPCRTTPAAPTNPYGDPAGYYGRSLLPE